VSEASVQALLQRMPEWEESMCQSGTQKVFRALRRCRTEALGYHLYRCGTGSCAGRQMRYHSCRNRHCPSCGGSRQQAWVEARMRELIPCKYYHVVFTLPHELNGVVLGNRKVMFDLLFASAHYTLEVFGRDDRYLGGRAGVISILHTWGQNLSFHPHVHCIVSGGGLGGDGRWREAKKARYGRLYPVKAMEQVYRGRFMRLLKHSVQKGQVRLPEEMKWPELEEALYGHRWVVYAKEPFGGPQQVLQYLGRYTHKVAISNSRIRRIDSENRVTFSYKDYAAGGTKKEMKLSGEEFLRRFEQHILPSGYCKIRSCGLYANHGRSQRIGMLLEQLGVPAHGEAVQVPWHVRMMATTGRDPLQCPVCTAGRLELLEIVRAKVWESQMQKPPEA